MIAEYHCFPSGNSSLLLSQEVFDLIFMQYLLLKSISSCLWTANSLYHLCIILCFRGGFLIFCFDRRFCCFCHDSNLKISKFENLRMNVLLFSNQYIVKFSNCYLISLWTVTFFMIGLNFFNSSLSGLFFLFFLVMYRLVPGKPLFLCSVHSRITCTRFPFFAIVFWFENLWFWEFENLRIYVLSFSSHHIVKVSNCLNMLTLCPQFLYDRIKTILIDRTDRFSRYF